MLAKERRQLDEALESINCQCGSKKDSYGYICSNCENDPLCECGCKLIKRLIYKDRREYSSIFKDVKFCGTPGEAELEDKIRTYRGTRKDIIRFKNFLVKKLSKENKFKKFHLVMKKNGRTKKDTWLLSLVPRKDMVTSP